MLILADDEHIVATARKHWLVFAVEAAGIAIALLAAIGILVFVHVTLFTNATATIDTGRLIALDLVLLAGLFLIALMAFSVALTNFYLDIVVVTTRRVIDFDQRHIFSRDIATIPVGNVIDVKVEIAGILQTFLKYGTIHVQTAGAIKEMHIRGITNPHGLKTAIIEMRAHSASVQIPPSIPPPTSPTEH